MPLARVTQGQISVAQAGWRVPVDYNEGQEVDLSDEDFKRLSDAGAVCAAKDYVEPETADEEPEEDAAEATIDQLKVELSGLTHDQLDRKAKGLKVKVPANASKSVKIEALAEAMSSDEDEE
jgi:hypothetical protein